MSHYPSDSYRFGAANRDPEEEALGWVVRLTSGDATEEDHRQFLDWSADQENAAAYANAKRLWVGLGPVLERQEESGWPIASLDLAAAPAAKPRFRWARLGGVAASLLLIGLLSVGYVRDWQYDQVSGTVVAQAVALDDGSHVTMGPNTAFSKDFANGARHITLARGEAYFDVRHDPAHPFIVSAGNGLVRVLGTAFSVRRRSDDETVITVSRGRVEVTSGAQRAILTPDRQISFNSAGLGRLHAVDASLAMAWMRGRLIMENKPLSEVLSELDRYQGGKILLLNREAGERRINAVIDLGRIDSWLTALASSQGLRLNSAGPITILR